LDGADFLEYLEHDDETRIIGMYLEGVKDEGDPPADEKDYPEQAVVILKAVDGVGAQVSLLIPSTCGRERSGTLL